MAPPTTILDNFLSALFFLVMTLIISWIAFFKGYFELPYSSYSTPKLRTRDFLITFLIFFCVFLLIAPFIISLLPHSLFQENEALFLSLLQLFIFITTSLLLFCYDALQNRKAFLKVWKDSQFVGKKSLLHDISLGFISWFIAIPTVSLVSHLADILKILLFGPTNEEQLAVKFLKMSMQTPSSMILALITILICAPFLEEYLFRGVFQTWLRHYMRPRYAILISSLAFALFHYSPSHSYTNFPLILTLFTFAIYLGFVYEKSRSLITSIVLHVTFNSISVIRIILNYTQAN